MKRFRILLTAVLAGVLMGLSLPGYTDDTSLYRGQVDVLDENSRPNILFVLDRSGSMAYQDEVLKDDKGKVVLDKNGDPEMTGPTRMETLQEALLRLMDDMHNVNVGFMTFTGQEPGDKSTVRESVIQDIKVHGKKIQETGLPYDKSVVPVRFPITYIDEPVRDVFGDKAYVQSESRLLLSADDAEEDIKSNNVVLDDAKLEAVYSMATDMTPGKILVSQIADNADDAMEFRTGSKKGTVYSVGEKFKKIGLGGSGSTQTLVGLRFAQVKLPPDANILKANILFTAQVDNATDLNLVIHGINRSDAESFENLSNDISSESNYPKTTASKDWEPRMWTKEEVYSTPDIGEIIQEIVDLSDGGTEGYTIAFTIKNPEQYSSKYPPLENRSFYTRDSSASKAPQLSIVYEVPEAEGGIAGIAGEMTTVTQQVSKTNNDATEYRGGGGNKELETGSVFTGNKNSLQLGDGYKDEKICRGEALVGLRFTNLEIPQDAIIIKAEVEFTANPPKKGLNKDDPLNLMIHAQDSFDSNIASEFNGASSGSVTNDLSSRSRMSESISWNVPVVLGNEKLVTANFSSLVQNMVTDNNWESADNALVLLFARANEGNGERDGSRYVYDFSASTTKAPILRIDWVKKTEAVNQKVGLRFQKVQIPRGAKVISARIDFTSSADDEKSSSLKIHGEAHDDSPMFTSEQKNISDRELTTKSVNWNNIEAWHSGEVYSTPDLTPIVQNIVLREEWCGANAMSFIISENGSDSLRNIKSFDDSPKNAPVLHVEYDLDTVPEDTCINEIYSKQISHINDDAEEMLVHQGGPSDDVFLTSPILEMTTTVSTKLGNSERLVGLRFPQIPIARNTRILKAELVFTARKSDNKDTTLKIMGEKSPSAEEFKGESSNLTKRRKTAAKIPWKPDAWTVGQKYSTVNIAEIVQEIIDQPKWRIFNNMAFFIGGKGLRSAISYEYDSSQAVILRIQMEGGKSSMTARQHIKDMINGMTIGYYTPLVDAIYEAGQYYMGGRVTHGKDRIQQKKGPVDDINDMVNNRVSHPGSWDQDTGELYQANGCTNANLRDESCITEEIKPKGGNYTSYIQPKSALCQHNFIVFLTDGGATINSSAELIKALPNIELEGGECKPHSPGNESFVYTEKEICGVDMVEYLYNQDLDTSLDGKQNVITYTIGLAIGNEEVVKYLQDWAEVGGGSYYNVSSSADELYAIFTKILGNVIVKSSSFAAPSLSINVFNQLYHDNEIYVSLFKPGHQTSWPGNLKKYKLCNKNTKKQCDRGQIMDANDEPAINTETYKISEDALGFWTKSITTEPDGNEVDKGGAGAVLLKQVPKDRHIYTNVTVDEETGEVSNNLTSVDIENEKLKPSYFGENTKPAERNQLINWIRGYKDGNPSVGKRNWLFLDSLHTSPGAITTGKRNKKTITKIFAATNGGEIRALDAKTGQEDWVFIPKEMLSIQKRLMENKGDVEHTYGIDGEFAFLIEENDGIANSIKLFIGMRRGGRNIYALDVTPDNKGDYTSSYKPKLMWTIRGGEEGFKRLGQTWSMPKPAKVRFANGAKTEVKTVLLFGGGYEAETQDESQSFSPVDQFSNAIYMVDSDNGELLWWVSNTGSGADLELDGMEYSIPSNLALIDNTGDGVINRIYVGDTGGNVWRIDLGPNLGGGDSVGRKLASLGIADVPSSGISNLRQFFYAPDVVMMNDPYFSSQAKYDMVLINSGSRPDPLGTYTSDRFYALRDPDIGSLSKESVYEPLTHSDLFDATDNIICKDSDENEIQVLKDSKGWYIDLQDLGEKGLSSPFVLDGTVYFTTFVPGVRDDADICSTAQGGGIMYALDILNGGAALNYNKDNDLTTEEGEEEKVKDKTDRKRKLGAGIPSSVQAIITEEGISIVVGTGAGIETEFVKTIGTNQIFWLQK